MMRGRRQTPNIHESFSDVALLMLATFVFLLVTILITTRMAEQEQIPKLKDRIEELQQRLDSANNDKQRLAQDLEEIVVTNPQDQLEKVLKAASLGKKDFDLFVEGLKDIPGDNIHLVVDASGSMHGVSSFLIPILRVIVTRSGKRLDAITWFSDYSAQTYMGSMGEMFDQLIKGAPFSGNLETVGKGLRVASQNAALPGAYMLIGDEPSDDTIYFHEIARPVFTLAMGRSDPATTHQYQLIADKTGGKMLHMEFK